MSKKKKKRKYFPNNYDAVAQTPSEYFSDYLPTFEEFMDWKIGGYELPSSINCIIRETRCDTGEVTEYVYNTAGHAKRKATQIMNEGVSEFVVATAEQLHYLRPEFIEEYDDPLS